MCPARRRAAKLESPEAARPLLVASYASAASAVSLFVVDCDGRIRTCNPAACASPAGGALAWPRVMGTLVFGVRPSDPVTFAAVGDLLTLVALSASLVPAFRALRLDPVKTFRAE